MTSIFQPAPIGGSVSDVLVGKLFWATNDTPKDGLCFSGRTYSWVENPKLKQQFDDQGHAFIEDNLDGTFNVVVVQELIRGTQSNSSIGVKPIRGDNLTSTPSPGSGEERLAIFGIYGDQAVVAVDTTLASQGSLSTPNSNEWLSSQDAISLISDVNLDQPGTTNTDRAPTQRVVKGFVNQQLFPYTQDSIIDIGPGLAPAININNFTTKEDFPIRIRNIFTSGVITLSRSSGSYSTYALDVDGFNFASNTIVPNSVVEVPFGEIAEVFVSSREQTVYIRPSSLGSAIPEVTQAELDQVVTDYQTADSNIATALVTETTNRIDADNLLQTDINTRALQANLLQEVSDRIQDDNLILNDVGTRATQTALAQEIADRQQADQDLADDIPVVWEDLDNVDFTNAPVTGGLFVFNGTDVVPNSTVLIDVDGCSLETKDETGKDWCNWQFGTNGSAFLVLKKSLGSIDTPAAITSNTKIGGFAFIGEDLVNSEPGYVGAEVSAFATENHSGTTGGTRLELSATPTGTKTRVNLLETNSLSEPIFPQYPNTRDDGETDSALYTDANGELKRGKIQNIPENVKIFGGNINGSLSQVFYDDDFVSFSWDTGFNQPQFLLKSTAPTAWSRPCITFDKLDGNGSTTATGESADRRLTGRPQLVLDTLRYFSRSGNRIGAWDLESFGSSANLHLMRQNFVSGFPAYQITLFAGDVNNISYIVNIINL